MQVFLQRTRFKYHDKLKNIDVIPPNGKQTCVKRKAEIIFKMILSKNGETISLTNTAHIAAYKNNGWAEALPKKVEKKSAPTTTNKKPKTKAV